MKERPILFSAPMLRALLAGTKTQTRRIAKGVVAIHATTGEALAQLDSTGPRVLCPYGQPGDRLWVRETWQYYDWTDDGRPCIRFAACNQTTWPTSIDERWSDRLTETWEILSRDNNFLIDGRARDRRWRPAIHMPRWACRILPEIVSVRVERLNDISRGDAMAEGCPFQNMAQGDDPRAWYAGLWEEINGTGSWSANPWVWVVEFKRIEGGAK